jgi:hypothetical protein
VRGVAAALFAVLALAGCAGAFGTPMGSPKQLKEMAKIKDAACTKVTGVYMGATITITAVNVDKGIPKGDGGTVKIGADCATEITAPPTR